MTRAALRVLMTSDTVGGVFNHCVELARELGRQHVEVALATMGPALSREQRVELRALRHVEVVESRFKLEWMEQPWRDVARAGEWLLRIEERIAPDCIHSNGYTHGALAWRAPVLVAGHSCVLSWWQAVHGVPAPAQWLRYGRAVRRGLSRAQVIVAPSRAMLGELERLYGPLRNARVIANGVQRARVPRALKQPIVLAAGRLWDEAKNVRALVGAAPQLPWPVLLAGDERPPPGTGEGECEDARRPSAIDPSAVRLLGRLDRAQLASWFERAAIYALPARYEPFGLSVLEAALADCALVLGDIPSLRENWTGAALFVPADDREALIVALSRLIAEPARRTELASRARARARRFGPETMAAAYRAAYAATLRRADHDDLEETTACA